MNGFNKAIVALVLALSIGVQWPLLQSVAWLNMLVTFSAEGGIQQGLIKTFDGKHACKLCKFVSEGKAAEKKNSTQSVKKFDLMLVTPAPIFVHCEAPAFQFELNAEVAVRFYPPLSPPPDLA